MSTLLSLWWLLFLTVAGLCLGSFLNVVVYRLPRNRSLRSPLWSACPYCRKRIRWHDNLPLISFVWLRGRCRFCRAPISPRYLAVEALTALIVLMLLDAFFIGQSRAGLSDSPVGFSERLAHDWPIFAAHVVLFACLLSMSAIDLEHYWVDVRFTNFASLAGFLGHAFWTPRHSAAWPRPGDALSVVSLLALAGLGFAWVLWVCDPRADPEDFGEPAPPTPEPPDEALPEPPPTAPIRRESAVWGLMITAVLLGLLFALIAGVVGEERVPFAARVSIPSAAIFLLLVQQGTVSRSSDREIIEQIHEERHTARRMVLAEFGWLLPAVALGAVGCWLMNDDDWSSRIQELLHARAPLRSPLFLRDWSPLQGLATAAAGYIIGGALGWVVRIVFTLAIGKEAFGVGDIHLLAAAGCVAGWPIAVLGFFLTCGTAFAGWLLALPFKRARAVPLGPWLSLSFLVLVVLYDPILHWPPLARALDALAFLVSASGPRFWIETSP